MPALLTPKVNIIPPRRFLTTVDDLSESLGWVPANRIRINPPPGTATEADVLRFLESEDKRVYELIDGTLVEKAMGMKESILAATLSRLLGNFVEEFDLGVVAGSDGPFRMLLGNIRYPDVSFIPWTSIPDEEIPDEKIWSISPALAIEVLSESNTVAEIDRKIGELFKVGCRLIWVIDPKNRTATVYTSPSRFKHYDSNDSLDGGKVLHGFQLALSDLFASTKRKKKKTR